MPDSVASQLIVLLDRERDAICQADFDTLAKLAAHKDAILIDLPKHWPSKAALRVIRHKAARNEALFNSAIRGVKSARVRIDQLTEMQVGMRVYGADGRLEQVRTGPGGLEHKA